MSSSFVKDCSDASAPPSTISLNQASSTNLNSTPAVGGGGGNKTVFIIVNNDTQIDQEQLTSLLASHAGNSSEVSVVQMDGGGGQGGEYGGHDPTSTLQAAAAVGLLNPSSTDHVGYPTVEGLAIDAGGEGTSGYSELPLDAESLHQLESVLCLDDARQLLGSDDHLLDMLSPPVTGGGQNGGCWRRLSPTAAAHDSSATSDSDTNNVDPSEGSSGTDSRGAKTGGRGRGRAPPKRRSQRQQDKAERDEVSSGEGGDHVVPPALHFLNKRWDQVTKILAENQRIFQLEREQLLAAAAAAAGGSLSSTDGTASAPLPGNSGRAINNLNIEVQVEFDHQTQRQGTNEDGGEVGTNTDNRDEGDSDDDDGDKSESELEKEDDEEEEEEDDAEKEEKDVPSRPRGGSATRSRGRPGRPPGRGERGASRGRGRGRAKATAGEESVPGRGRGRGRGSVESEEGSATGRRTVVKLRAAPPSLRAKSRGRGRGGISKGKQIPVMPESEDDDGDDVEKNERCTTQLSEGGPLTTGVGATNTNAAAADDQIDLLEKQLSHLHGESSDGDDDSGETSFAPPRPGTMAHLRDVLTDRASEGSDVPTLPTEVLPTAATKKILFLKRGSIGAAKGMAMVVPKASEDGALVKREAAVEAESDKRGEERGEEVDVEVGDDKESLEDERENEEEEDEEEEDEDESDEGAGDDDYKPPRDVTNTEDLSVDGSREDTQDAQEELSPKKKKGKSAKGGTKSSKPKKDENDSPRKKKKTAKKEKPEKAQLPKKDIIKKIIDKKGNIRYVRRRVVDLSYAPEREEKSDVKPAVKKASNPQDYLKILELAQMNVESAAAAQAKKKPAPKPLPDPKIVLKKMRETMSEGGKSRSQTDEGGSEGKEGGQQPKKSESNIKEGLTSDRRNEHRKNSSSDDSKTLPSLSPAASTSPQDNNKNPNRNPLSTSAQKKPKMFSAALDVPYETLKKPKFVKKIIPSGSGDPKAAVPLNMTREAILSRAKQDEAQSYKDANKMLLNKLESKLGKVSKNAQVSVDLVQHSSKKKSNPNVKKVNSPSPKKFFPLHKQGQRLKQQQSSRYKEEFDDEDEELDDLEEYKPLPPVSKLNIRRSKRPPKKKSFGDEMIMFDEKETLSDEEEDEEMNVKAEEDQEEEIDEDDEGHHTLKRRRRVPKNDEQFFVDLEVVDHLGKPDDQEDGVKEVEEEEEDDEDQQSSSDEFVEEDDPERLWCVCQRPHNNRFMICCDQCENWFHGSCVGITKAMGKQMEEAGREWVCPKCNRKDTSFTSQDGGVTGPTDQCQAGYCKRRRVPGWGPLQDAVVGPADQCRSGCCKRRRVTGSLFCSDECTLAHAAASVSAATGHDQNELNVAEVTGRKPTLEQQVKNEPRVLVANARTGQVLSGKDAPTLSELTEWLRRHPDFTLVKPSAVNSSRTTPSSKGISGAPGGVRRNSESGGGGSNKPGRVTINVSKAVAEAGFRDAGPSGSNSAPIIQSVGGGGGGGGGVRKTILLTSVKAPSQSANNITAADVDEPQPRKNKNETPLKPARQYKKRSRSESESKPDVSAAVPTPSAPTLHDIRRNVRKALTDSLLKRVEDSRAEFPDMQKEGIERLVKQIEEELFCFFNKSVNIKYKSRYRSLVFNIRDPKNGGLFRQILTGAASPQKLATMTSDEMASKELAEWRQTQGKKELEAIQKHELDMISLGNTYIMKSHKGEIEIDKDEFIKDKETAPETLNQLPEEEPLLPDPVVTAISSGAGAATSGSTTQDRETSGDHSSSKQHKSSRDSRDSKESRKDGDRDKERDRHRKHSRDDDRDRKRRHSGSSRRDEESSSASHKKRHHSDSRDHKRDSRDDKRDSKDIKSDSKDERRDRKDDRRSSSDSKRDKSDRKRHDSNDRHHRDKRRDSSGGDKSRRSKHDEVSTSDDVITNERRLELSVIEEERDGEPSSTVGPLPGELNYDESRKLLPLPPNLPTHLPQDQDDLLPPASPTLPMEDDPSYIPPYSPEAIPPQSPIPARGDTNQYMLSSPQTPPLDLSPSSTPPPLEEDGGGEYSPSAPPFSNHKKSKTSDYRPSTYSSKKKLSRSCLSKFDLPQQVEGERIAIWRGVVQMNDVAKFAATAFEVSGGSVNFTQDVPETIGVVGRISPDTVWAYIADTKKAASKEILVVRFQPTCEEEKVAYIALYSYLSSKKRYGVLGHIPNSSVKDFYIIPLASHQPIPQVLLPLDGPGFEEQRPHMLVGVVVRPKPKRIYDPFSGTWKDLPDAKLSEESSAMLSELKEASERSFTPPLPSAAAALIPSTLTSSGGTAPYDPEDEEESKESSSSSGKSQLASRDGKIPSKEEEQSYTPSLTPTNTPPGAPDDPSDNEDDIVELPQSPSNKAVKRRSDESAGKQAKKIKKSDLSREQESMLAELNRQIEEHKKELKCMQMTISSGKDDETSTGVLELVDSTGALKDDGDMSVHASDNVESDQVKLDTTKINIPDNLHMILESIKRKEDEIKEKEAEILRRKNEALSSGSGDTDMRMLLPPPQHQRVAAPVTVPPPHDAALASQQRPSIAAGLLPPAAVVGRPAATAAAASAALSHLRGGSTLPLGHPTAHPQQMNHPAMSHPPPQQRPSAQPPVYLHPPQTQAYHHPAALPPHHHQQVPPPIAGGVSAPPYHQHPPAVPHPHHQAALIPPHSGFDQRGPPPMVGGPPPVGPSVPPRTNYPHAAAISSVVPHPRPHEYPHPPGPGVMPGGPSPRQRPAPFPDQYGPPRVGPGVREPPAAALGPSGGPIRSGPEAVDGYRGGDQYVDRRDRYNDDRYGDAGGRYGGPPPPPGPPYEPDHLRRQSRDYHQQQRSPQQHFRGRDDAYAGYGRGGEYEEYEGRGDDERGGRGGQWSRGGGGGRGRMGDWGGCDDRGHSWGRGGRGRR